MSSITVVAVFKFEMLKIGQLGISSASDGRVYLQRGKQALSERGCVARSAC